MMQSAAYDGHCKSMLPTVGVLNADPLMKVPLNPISSTCYPSFDFRFSAFGGCW